MASNEQVVTLSYSRFIQTNQRKGYDEQYWSYAYWARHMANCPIYACEFTEESK